MKRNLIVKLALDEAEQELFRGRSILIVPLTDAEAAGFGMDVIATHEALGGSAVDIEGVIDQLGQVSGAERLVEGLTAWRNLVEGLHSRMDRVRQIIGRGKGVGEGDGKTEPKGVMQ